MTAHRQDIDSVRLSESLILLGRGTEDWNTTRAERPEFVPYLPATALGARAEHIGPLDGIDLRGADLREASLFGASLQEANLAGADLSGADLDQVQAENADFTGAKLDRATFEEANLQAADLSLASLNRASFDESFASFAMFHEAELERATFVDAELLCTDFQRANLRNSDLSAADAADSFWMEATMEGAKLDGTRLRGADLSGADLTYATMIHTDLSGANLEGAKVFGTAVWGVNVENTRQQHLVISSWLEPVVVVDDLEVAQFVYTLLNHKKLRKAIMAVSERGVLLLGRFQDGGLELLQAVADQLRALDYLPMLFDFDRPDDRNYTETVKVLAGLSRFVIADLSGPSVPQELYATVPHFKIPFVPVLEAGRKPHGMAADLLEYPWVVKPLVRFTDAADLAGKLRAEVVRPAEKLHASRQKVLAELFG